METEKGEKRMNRLQEEKEPKAGFSLSVTREEYRTASLLAARRHGSLRALPAAVVVAAALLALGLFLLDWDRFSFTTALIPLFLCLCCPALLIYVFFLEPQRLRGRADEDYETYQALMKDAVLYLYPDYAVTRTPDLRLHDQYALIGECIETPELFVFLKESERLLILPKRCLPPEKREELEDFLRLAFVRRRHVMRNWVF